MNAQHTPGPWEAFKGIEASNELRCGVSAMRGTIGYLVATIENGAPGDFCETEFANARLIAAAPDLLKAAQGYLTAAPSPSTRKGTEAWDALRAAIAKATGV